MLNLNFRETTATDNPENPENPVNSPAAHGGGRPHPPAELELWGGIECTVNRVGDEYFDQLERSGHATRLSDLDLLASLGIRALRYPVLWERTAPEGPARADWRWADERLAHLRELGVRPIVGLVHHGSGPRYTSLVDPCFPEKLAEYAGAVAARFPWVEAYTPVNEILTTARFSGLYGHWYPHGKDGRTFARALISECRGTVMAMQAVRRVNPAARLVQTDDLSKTYSTPALAYQADFDNERRWLGWDLTSGRVTPGHPMWNHLQQDGISQAELEWFLENPCPPDVLGINYYPNSERILDERMDRYPEWSHGGNALQAYADVEAVRVVSEGLAGPRVLLREAWERYGIPIAITEVHHGCTREEQMRWLLQVWQSARWVRGQGVDVRAVTVWAMLGLYDWNVLCVRCSGNYEPGVFDLRSGTPRPTALARMLTEISAGRTPHHPVLAAPGWWERADRLHYPPVRAADGLDAVPAEPTRKPEPPRTHERGSSRRARPLLITGATGTLGRAFARLCEVRGLPYRLLRRQEMDIAVPFAVEDALDNLEPWAVINTAGYVRVDEAEAEPQRCYRENVEGPEILARMCAKRGLPLVTFSSDLVFDGAKAEPYHESDPARPLCVYGRTKAEAEQRVLDRHPAALVLRTSAFFGPWDAHNFITQALRELRAGRPFVAMEDAVVSPTYVPDLVHATLDLLIDGESGLWHLANRGAITWLELARQAAVMAGVDPVHLEGRPAAAFGLAARRPAWSVLGSERALLLPPLQDALARYVREREPLPVASVASSIPTVAVAEHPVEEGALVGAQA